jgi:hypothetical protein
MKEDEGGGMVFLLPGVTTLITSGAHHNTIEHHCRQRRSHLVVEGKTTKIAQVCGENQKPAGMCLPLTQTPTIDSIAV